MTKVLKAPKCIEIFNLLVRMCDGLQGGLKLRTKAVRQNCALIDIKTSKMSFGAASLSVCESVSAF